MEQLTEADKTFKRKPSSSGNRTDNEEYGQGWDIVKGNDGYTEWEFFRCAGFHSLFVDKKIFTINVNF